MAEQEQSGEKSDDRVLRALHRRVVFVFDFDETFAPRTTDALLEHLGVDPDEFDRTQVKPLVENGWNQRLAEAAALVELSQSDAGPITDDTFSAVADGLQLYPGVVELFDRLRSAVHDVSPESEVEFYLITAGFVEVPQHTSIAHEFTQILGGRWAFADDGAIRAPKTTLGHYAKVRHLMAIAKGLDSVRSDRDHDIDREIPESEWHVPYEQMIFVGDGDSDLPGFDFMESHSGTAVAVYQAKDQRSWESRADMRRGRQVVALAKSDYSDGSPLLDVLTSAGRRAGLWIEMIATGRD